MKKRITALVLVVLLLFLTFPITSFAANSAQVVAENYTASQGGYAYIYLRANDFVDVAVIDIELYYDSSVMSVHYVSNGTLFNGASVSTNTSVDGTVKISAMSVKGFNSTTSNYSNRMMTVCFKIKADCPIGNYPIAVTVGHAYDNNFTPVDISGVNGVVTVTKAAAQNFPIYGTISNSQVQTGDTLSINVYHSSSYKFASADFHIEYDRELLKFNSIELDSKLLAEGAVHSINSANPGIVVISFASTNAVSASNLFKVHFDVIADIDAKTNISFIASDVYTDDLIAYAPYTLNSEITITKKEILPDNPDLFITTIPYVVGEESTATVNLEANAPVAAGDFSIKYDNNVFSVTHVTASNEVLSNGALVVINDNFSNGEIKFSYVNEKGFFDKAMPIIEISLTPISSPDKHFMITPDGFGVCDINYNDVTLDYIAGTNCIYNVEVIKPTCTEQGYTSYLCSCGENYINDYINPTGHSYKNNEFVCDNCGFVNYPYGDLTGDLKVNIIDFIKLKKIILGIAESSGYKADLDDSGDITAIDLIVLKKLLLTLF